jgi:predicted dehydrogenase
VVCERAALDYRTTGQAWVTPDEATLFTHDGEKVTPEHFKEDSDAYGAETDDFLQAIHGGGKTRSPARDGLNSLRVVLAVLESAQRGSTIVKT